MCAPVNHEREVPFTAGVQGPLKRSGSSRVSDDLSCYLRLTLDNSDSK